MTPTVSFHPPAGARGRRLVRLAGLAAALALLPGLPGALTATDAPPELREKVFAPELIMRHQAAIGLTEEQRQRLVEEVQRTQIDLVPLQLELSGRVEELVSLMGEHPVSEADALALAGEVMELENRVKLRHLALVVRLKNLLTPEQQALLRSLREEAGR